MLRQVLNHSYYICKGGFFLLEFGSNQSFMKIQNDILIVWLFFVTALLFFSCSNPNWKEEAANPDFLIRSQKKLTDVIVHDIFSPPVASRIYAYPNIAAFEILQNDYSNYNSLENQLTDFQNVPKPKIGEEYCFPLASIHAFLTIGKSLIIFEPKIESFEKEIYAEFEKINMPKAVYKRSMDFGQEMSEYILAWADKDNYNETRTLPKYTITDDESKWRPTPPDYMDGIEPHWSKIRPFVLKSADQFLPPPPTEYDMKDTVGLFYQEVTEVYNALNVETKERENRQAIAKFWDCNPYVSTHKGHVMYSTKKITPGGHWMGIARLASKQNNANMMKTAEGLMLTALALADGFIACWDEKYRSNLVRPETVINRHIDEEWKPLLQTPPFPEYTSGHSVISRAAAVALTRVYGENFEFLDTVEEEYGLPARQFKSFLEASDEAAISRLYGGIHYRPACANGVVQGEKIGRYVVENLKTKQ